MALVDYTGATQAKAALLTNIKNAIQALDLIEAEVVAARDGEDNLLAQIDSLRADISLLGDAELPGQTGKSGYYLTTDGLTSSWTDAFQYDQIADASLGTGTHTFDYSAGDMQQLTATGDITLAFSNFPTGYVASFFIDAVNWGAHTILYPAGILFPLGTAPSYTASGTDRLMVIKDADEAYSLFVIGFDIKVVT